MKRNILIILAICLTFVLCGCQAKNIAQETSGQDNKTTVNSPEVTEDTDATTPAEDTVFTPYLLKYPVFHSEDIDYSLSNKTIESILDQKRSK